MKYRLVLYDSNKKFKSVFILDNIVSVKQKISENTNSFYELYKCNNKGNNYSGRNITLDLMKEIANDKV